MTVRPNGKDRSTNDRRSSYDLFHVDWRCVISRRMSRVPVDGPAFFASERSR